MDRTITLRTIVWNWRVAGSIARYGPEDEREVTYYIGKEFWGLGVATEALRQFLQVQATRPIYGRAAKDNAASIRVMQKCGFSVTGSEKGFANARGEEIEEVALILRAA